MIKPDLTTPVTLTLRLHRTLTTVFDSDVRRQFCERVRAIPSGQYTGGSEPVASVLLPICRVEGVASLLYTVRPLTLRRHGGEVSFPGGLQSPGDDDLQHTALRETQEELRLKVDRQQIWGAVTDFPSTTSGRVVRPFVADLGDLDLSLIDASEEEVDHVFALSLDSLCRPENFGSTQFRSPSFSAPVFLNGPHRVWGLSAIFTHFLLVSLLPEQYKSQVQYIKPIGKIKGMAIR